MDVSEMVNFACSHKPGSVERANPTQGRSLWCHEVQRRKEARRTNTPDQQVWQLRKNFAPLSCALKTKTKPKQNLSRSKLPKGFSTNKQTWVKLSVLSRSNLFFPSNAFMAFARSLHTFNRSKKMNCESCKAVYTWRASKALVMDQYTVQRAVP